jgi:hypothetical protein
MTVSVAGTVLRAAVVGEVIDMPRPDVYVVKDDRTGQYVTVHDSEVYWFAIRD